jgi:hypothetical protein
VAGAFASGFLTAGLLPEYRFALRRHIALCLLGLGYLAVGWCLDVAVPHVADLVRYNTGQFRHALDMTFASVALAVVLASAIVPPAAGTLRAKRHLSRFGSASWSMKLYPCRFAMCRC